MSCSAFYENPNFSPKDLGSFGAAIKAHLSGHYRKYLNRDTLGHTLNILGVNFVVKQSDTHTHKKIYKYFIGNDLIPHSYSLCQLFIQV